MNNAGKSKLKIGVAAFVLIVISVAIATRMWPGRWGAVLNGSDAAQTGAIAVQTELAARRDIAEFVTASGKVQPLVLVKISPEVSGEIVALPFKEGETVKKGDLIIGIKPDYYAAARNSAQAAYKAAVANRNLARANLERATFEIDRIRPLFNANLVSEAQLQEAKTAFEVAAAQHEVSGHQAEMAKSAVVRADEDVAKTSVFSPITGVVTRLSSQLGERVVGTATMAGTEVMQIADLNEMEARVDVGEVDVVLIQPGQSVTLDIDAVRTKKFSGVVTHIANMPNNAPTVGGARSQEATKFEVRIRVNEKYPFRPGMSVSAVIQTRSRANVLSVPIQCVTTRAPKESPVRGDKSKNAPPAVSKPGKPIEVVFVAEGERVRMVPIERGISDDSYVEIISGITEAQTIVTGSYKAINRELQDGSIIKVTSP